MKMQRKGLREKGGLYSPQDSQSEFLNREENLVTFFLFYNPSPFSFLLPH